jgi:hypothetical protein
MKPFLKNITLLAVCFLFTVSARAEEKASPAMKLIDAINFAATAKKSAATMMEPMIQQLKASGLPDEAIAEFKEASDRFLAKTFDDPATIVELAKVYEKHFTNKEIEELLVFYQTPVGKKTLVTLPDVMQESMQVGQMFAAKNQEEFQKEIMAIMEKHSPKGAKEPESN